MARDNNFFVIILYIFFMLKFRDDNFFVSKILKFREF